MHATLPLMRQSGLSGHPAPQARNAAGQPRLQLQPDLRALPRQRRPDAHRDDVARDGRETCSRSCRRRARAALDITGGAPELNPHFRDLVTRARALGIARDRPLQPDHPRGARPGGPGGVPRRATGRGRRLAAVLPGGQRRPPARRGRVRGQHPRAAKAERPRLRQAEAPASSSTSSTTRRARRCRRRRRSSKPTTAATCGDRYGIAFNRLYTLTNMPIQRFGSTLISKGQFEQLHALLKDAYRAENLEQRDVPHAALASTGRATSTTATSTRCSACRCASTASRGRTSRSRSAATSTATRSSSPTTATAAPPDRARAAAARWPT